MIFFNLLMFSLWFLFLLFSSLIMVRIRRIFFRDIFYGECHFTFRVLCFVARWGLFCCASFYEVSIVLLICFIVVFIYFNCAYLARYLLWEVNKIWNRNDSIVPIQPICWYKFSNPHNFHIGVSIFCHIFLFAFIKKPSIIF